MEIVPSVDEPVTCYCDNNGAVTDLKELKSHKHSKHMENIIHWIRGVEHLEGLGIKNWPASSLSQVGVCWHLCLQEDGCGDCMSLYILMY